MRKKYRPTKLGQYTLGNLGPCAVAVWRDETGTRRRFRLGKALTQEQADAELTAFVRQREVFTARSSNTIAELFDDYLEDKKIDGKPTTNQRMHWKALGRTFGALSSDDISKKLCIDYKKRRLDEGCSIGTVWTELTALRAILNWAVKAKKIPVAPHVTIPSKPPPRDKHLERAQAQHFMDSCVMAHVRLFTVLALQTAGRMGAILKLTWARVDFDRNVIDLREPGVEETSKRKARVPMNATARAALLQAKEMALTDRVIEWNGAPVANIKKGLAAAAERAGMPWITAHVLRHTAARWMAEAGVPMEEISQFLGHTSTQVTERVYARFSPDHLQKAAAALEMPQVRKVENGSR